MAEPGRHYPGVVTVHKTATQGEHGEMRRTQVGGRLVPNGLWSLEGPECHLASRTYSKTHSAIHRRRRPGRRERPSHSGHRRGQATESRQACFAPFPRAKSDTAICLRQTPVLSLQLVPRTSQLSAPPWNTHLPPPANPRPMTQRGHSEAREARGQGMLSALRLQHQCRGLRVAAVPWEITRQSFIPSSQPPPCTGAQTCLSN